MMIKPNVCYLELKTLKNYEQFQHILGNDWNIKY